MSTSNAWARRRQPTENGGDEERPRVADAPQPRPGRRRTPPHNRGPDYALHQREPGERRDVDPASGRELTFTRTAAFAADHHFFAAATDLAASGAPARAADPIWDAVVPMKSVRASA